MDIKSKYELIMERLRQEGKVKVFTDEENLSIINQLNHGIEDFLEQLKLNEYKAIQDLKTIVLD